MASRRGLPGLGPASAVARYEAERRQGELIADGREDAWGWSTPAGRHRAGARASFLIEEVRLGPGVECLELGAGTGEFTARLASTGCRLTAIELSRRTAEICRVRVGSGVDVVVGNVETGEGLEGRSFDAIVGVSVLHHVDLDVVFARTFSTLRPGGRFAFAEPNLANPQVWIERNVPFVRRLRHVTPHETAFLAAKLRRRFEANGLIVEICEPFDFLHPALPRVFLPAALPVARALERTPARVVAGSIRISGHAP